MGDFNFHWKDLRNTHVSQFRSIIESYGLIQQVHTHARTHTHTDRAKVTSWIWQLLELTRTLRKICVEDPGLSDHSVVFFHSTGKVPGPLLKNIQYRLDRSIDVTSFIADLCASDLVLNSATTVSERVDQYNNILRELLDKHAPVMSKMVTV